MKQKQLIELANLLAKFHNTTFDHNGSLYGRNMDRALASDLYSALFAYGISGRKIDDNGKDVRDPATGDLVWTEDEIVRLTVAKADPQAV